MLATYSLKGKSGKYISWFGIVRKVESDPKSKKTKLRVQQCYSDGATDTHILTISLHGCGDFQVEADGDKLPILPLRAVLVYGVVEKYEGNTPVIKAEFIKEWDWGNFNFMDYGKDESNGQCEPSSADPNDVHYKRSLRYKPGGLLLSYMARQRTSQIQSWRNSSCRAAYSPW